MQQPGLDCERDEYPAIAFWQDQDIHSQYVRMVPRTQNGPAGRSLFGLNVCHYDGNGIPPASTRNAQYDRLVHGPDRDTEVSTADVTLTLATVLIRFDAYPNQPDFGLTANPCWPSTLVDDPGFALLNSDPWYSAQSNAQRHQTADIYSNPPPLAVTQNKPPRAGYDKRGLEVLDPNLISNEAGSAPPKGLSIPRANEVETTAADTAGAASTAAMVGGGVGSELDSIPKPTGRVQ